MGMRTQLPNSSTQDHHFVSSEQSGASHGRDERSQGNVVTFEAERGMDLASTSQPGSMAPPPRPHPDDGKELDMDIDSQPLPADAQPRNSSSSVATSAVSSDHLQLVVDRFRAFAQLCQDHMHPSAEMLDCLAPLIPKVIYTAAPFIHPKMICSPKVHSPEEAVALLAVASLRSSDSSLQDEGYRLICFVYGLVMLSYKQTLHVEGNLHSFLNCFLLVGIYSSRQATPDLWHKLRDNCEAVVLDVLRPDSCNHFKLDSAMDRIDPAGLKDLPDEELYLLWLRWYKHESWKRTLLFCAIKDSQAAGGFPPLNIDLAARPQGTRCQAFFAYASEPCPDAVFLAWPPKVWAARVTSSVSLPSSKGARLAFQGESPGSIAACLTEQLLRPHVAQVHGPVKQHAFRNSFDFGASSSAAPDWKHPRAGSTSKAPCRNAAPAPLVEITESASSSPQSPQVDDRNQGSTKPEARTVSQLYLWSLLEAIHGAWMADSGWYQSPSWGAAALPEQLAIDKADFDIDTASLADLPGWRMGRTLCRTQIAHALMNWSDMFSGWNGSGRKKSDETEDVPGLKITDDTHHATIRWQSVFLSLCVPLQSLCFYLDPSKQGSERHRKVTLLLRRWVDSPCCRRALVHAGTILTLLSVAKTSSRGERPGPAGSNAVYMSLVVLVAVWKLLEGRADTPQGGVVKARKAYEELVPTRVVWKDMLGSSMEGALGDAKRNSNEPGEAERDENGDWLRVRYWHRKYQYLGLAGIFRHQGTSSELYADWRTSVSAGTEAGPLMEAPRNAPLRPRWSSITAESRWSAAAAAARRQTIHVPHVGDGAGASDQHRTPHVQSTLPQPDSERDSLRRRLLSIPSGTNAWTETRLWILQGSTHNVTFCGLALWRSERLKEAQSGVVRQSSEEAPLLKREHLKGLVAWVDADNPAWCYAQEYSSLLLASLQESRGADTASAIADGAISSHRPIDTTRR